MLILWIFSEKPKSLLQLGSFVSEWNIDFSKNQKCLFYMLFFCFSRLYYLRKVLGIFFLSDPQPCCYKKKPKAFSKDVAQKE